MTKKKSKTGARLLWRDKKTAPWAQLMETRVAPCSPAEFYLELGSEDREPWGTSFVQSQGRPL